MLHVVQVAEDVYCARGTEVNWVIVREGSDLTLVDAGWRGDYDRLEASIREVGGRLEDIRGVLLTHAHMDHTGCLNRLWDRYRIPVYMHKDELANARGDVVESAKPVDVIARVWRPSALVWGVRMLRAGGLSHEHVRHAGEYSESGALDMPGGPVPIACPGHTSGHSAYLFPRHGVIATGDALVTGHPVLGSPGPNLLPAPFSLTDEAALSALNAFAGVDAGIVVPGHGLPWYGGLAEATARAREAASARAR